jgi:hypothetical protein
MLTDREYSFDMQTQFSKWKNVWDTSASNIEGILLADTRVSSIQQYRSIFAKLNFYPTRKL